MPWIDDIGWVEDTPPAPASYEEQVAMARSWGVPENQIASVVGTPQSVAANNSAQAQAIYEQTGSAPSWATPIYESPSIGNPNSDSKNVLYSGENQAGIGSFEQDQINALNKNQITFNAAPPSWLNPADYVANNFAAPYTQQQITGQVDPSWIRQMNGQTYASVKGPSDLSGGEYLIDPNTGKFALDKNGNPIGVTYPKSNNFDDWVQTPMGSFMLMMTPLLAAGGVAAFEGLGALGAAEGVGQALPYTEAFDAWNLAQQGLSSEAIAQNLAATGMNEFLAADVANLAAQGISEAQIAQVIGASYSAPELAGTAFESLGWAPAAATTGLNASQLANLLKGGSAATKALTGSSSSGANSALTNALSKLAQGQSGMGMEIPGIVRTNQNPFYNTPQVALQTPQKTETSQIADLLRQGKPSWQT